MKQFLNKYIYVEIKLEDRVMRHKCALLQDISETHITILDTYDNNPYLYRISDVIEIKLSNKQPGVSNGFN